MRRLEEQLSSLGQQLGRSEARGEQAAAASSRLQEQVVELNKKLTQKEARMRASMDALSRVSQSMRTSLKSAVRGGRGEGG